MAKMDWGMDDEVQRLQRRLPAEGGGGGTSAPAAAPSGARATRQQAGGGARAAGANARSGFVRTLNAGAGRLESAVNTAAAPFRAVADTTAQFAAGATGRRAPAPLPNLTIPRVRDTGASLQVVGAGGPPRASAPRGGRPMAQANFDNPGNNVSAAAPAVAVPGPANGNGTVDLGEFSGDQGYETKGFLESARNGNEAAPMAVYRGLQRDPQDLANRTINQQAGVARRARSQVMGGLPRDEIVRRLENSQGSYFNKGRPSARAAIAGVYADQLAAADGTSARLQEGGNNAALSGMRGATEGELAQQDAANAGVLEAQRQRGERRLTRLSAQLSGDAPETMVDASGNVVVRRGLTASGVAGPDGQPLRAPAAPQEGQITPARQLEALQAEMANLVDLPMVDGARAARIDQLQRQIDGLIGVPRSPTGVPDGAVKLLRSNPDPAAIAEFEAKFGPGSARYYLEG